MRRFATMVLAACFVVALPVSGKAIEIWHSNTVWANQGMCAFTFTLDGQDIQFGNPSGRGIGNLTLEIMLLDEDRNELGSPQTVRLAEPFADSDATRYAQLVIEGDCRAEIFGIAKAIGSVGGKQHNLLDTRQLTPRKFEPKDIILPAKYSEE